MTGGGGLICGRDKAKMLKYAVSQWNFSEPKLSEKPCMHKAPT